MEARSEYRTKAASGFVVVLPHFDFAQPPEDLAASGFVEVPTEELSKVRL